MEDWRPASVGELDMVELDLARHALRFDFPVLEFGLGLQKAQNPRCRRHRPLVEIERLAQSGEWPQKTLSEKHEYGVGGHLEGPVEDAESAIEEGHEEAGKDGDADHRHERR